MKAAVLLASVIVVGAGAALLAACATTAPADGQSAAYNENRYKCFDPSNVRNFMSVDDHTMVITSGWNEAYELKLGPACFGLDTSAMIGIRSRTGVGDICGPFDADILYSDLGDRHPQSCSVTAVRHLTGEEAAPYVTAKKRQ